MTVMGLIVIAEASHCTGASAIPYFYCQRKTNAGYREKEVAKLVAEGLLNREVGERLGGIAVKTVQVHRSEACSKLGVKGAAGLAQAVRAVEMALKVRQTP